MLKILRMMFGTNGDKKRSKLIAKKRLKQVLLRDRVELPPHFMRAIRDDVIKAADRYIDVGKQDVQIQLSADDNNKISLMVLLPILKIKPVKDYDNDRPPT